MPEVKFGTGQLSNPTPSRVSKILDGFTGIAGVVIAWIGTADFISSYDAKVAQSILGLLVGIAQVLKPFFGVQTNQRNVPIDDVKEMKSPDK